MSNPIRFSSLLPLLLLFFLPFASTQITDNEISSKKNSCYKDIDSGLWGDRCRPSAIERENCALRCLSPPCYELIYQSDPVISWIELGGRIIGGARRN